MTKFDDVKDFDPYHHADVINGRKWHYVDIPPTSESSTSKPVIVLVHGFPDFFYGWKNVIQHFTQIGHRIIVPTFQGFPRSEIPEVPALVYQEAEEKKEGDEEDAAEENEYSGIPPFVEYGLEDDSRELEAYSYKAFADFSKALLTKLEIPNAIFLGHDWGGAHVGRVAVYHPEIVDKLITVCIPALPFHKEYYPLTQEIKEFPHHRYQYFLGGPATSLLSSPEALFAFFQKSISYKVEGSEEPVELLSEQQVQYYVDEFSRDGRSIHGPVTQYKIRKVNQEHEQKYLLTKGDEGTKIKAPYLHIAATGDIYYPPSDSEGLEDRALNLTRASIEASHWVLIEKPDELNSTIEQWLNKEEASKHRL